jgi:branched-chain amino acid transport system ATP-binding protein
MTALLQITDLAGGYDGGRVLDGVSLEVEPGEILALIGRNGVGKTTLMRAIMGQVAAASGGIRLAGEEIGKLPPPARARRGVGYVPQGREIFTSLTVAENLQTGMQGNRARAGEMLEKATGYFPVLAAKFRQNAGAMSGGEQQQLAIARALVGEPRLLLLDEPSEGIQPSIVSAIGETLARIATETGTGMLLVEQDMGLVERLARRACVMDKGRIVATLGKTEFADQAVIRKYLAI